MIEVFKTNVKSKGQANKLILQIHKTFINTQANFDLKDRDKILRIKCNAGRIESSAVIDFLESFGFNAEVLPDTPGEQKGTMMTALKQQGYQVV